MSKNLKTIIYEVLKQDDRIWDEDKTELNETKLMDLVENIDEQIINLLLEKEELRNKFFVKIKDVYVFKTNDFRFFMEENKLDNSYTAYKNRIGLTDGKKFLKDTNDIVLNWPYKDCILEGGQSTEDGYDVYFEYDEKVSKTDEKKGFKAGQYNKKQAKRKEIFFNQVLAHDEIDRLLDEKAFINFKRYNKDGEQEVKEIKRDENGDIKENLIIKGNNLLALHSLKKEFAGKVKLIYIDPPYNTGNDSFKYNDNFNHSTWLTFMKNRLEIAREFLRDDGVIFISIDDNEQAYLKILMDEVFGRNNFINNICVKSRAGISNDKIISLNHNFLLFYSKNREIIHKKRFEIGLLKTEDDFKNYNKNDKDGKGDYALNPVTGPGGASKGNPFYEFLGIKNYWRFSKEKMQTMYNKGLIVKLNNNLYQKTYKKDVENKVKKISTWWDNKDFKTSTGTNELKKIFNLKTTNDFFKNPKPEKLIKYILELITKPGDIVLDYHLGSGTTAAVAHKMGRQYIGIEQMDYIEDIAVERLKNVINGEQTGISKAVEWKGGGDFIYFELAKWNEKAKKEILNKNSLEELIEFFDEMYETYFLNYNLKIKEFKEKVINEEEFKNLSLDEQKKMFIAMLDNNQMYVNKTEMEDEKFGIDKKDIELTKKFYNED